MARKQPPGTINVGRPGPFGNPAAIGCVCPYCGLVHKSAGETLPCYKKMLWKRLQIDSAFKQSVARLKGKILWCPGCGIGKSTCHARILENACQWLNSNNSY